MNLAQIDIDPLQSASAHDVLRWAIETFGDRFAVSTSFQREGMVILDIAARMSSWVRVFTLDTGRLPRETYDIIETVRARYGIHVELVSPDASEIEAMVTRFGPNLFYESLPFRNLCCHFRKVRPLDRKLAGLDAWAVGLRRSQAASREETSKIEQVGEKFKLSPLADWSPEQVGEYIEEFDVPQHPLYAKGYTSIGCEPCTRATSAGEHERAGRWWWETEGSKECGIHFTPEGRVERTLDVLVREILNSSNA
ncbi:MAG TPA: phosphoadenylyl-sulfate reductase [Bryobacteraceae bacterium]|nr:phosphoadenylyl-sulfate reductase [Bryobacteraceae bacterium]